MRMTRIFYRDNPAKFTEFFEVSEGQIINAFAKLRRLGYNDQMIIDCCKILISKVPELEKEADDFNPIQPSRLTDVNDYPKKED